LDEHRLLAFVIVFAGMFVKLVFITTWWIRSICCCSWIISGESSIPCWLLRLIICVVVLYSLTLVLDHLNPTLLLLIWCDTSCVGGVKHRCFISISFTQVQSQILLMSSNSVSISVCIGPLFASLGVAIVFRQCWVWVLTSLWAFKEIIIEWFVSLILLRFLLLEVHLFLVLWFLRLML